MRKFVISIVALITGLAIAFALPILVLATTTYSASLVVANTSSTTYTKQPIVVSANNTNLISGGYMASNGLDAIVKDSANNSLPTMLTTDKIWTVSDLPAHGYGNLSFTTGNTPASAMSIITGTGGHISIADNAALEPGSSFSIMVDGFVDTSYTNIYPVVSTETGGGDSSSVTSHTINLPSGIMSGDLLIVAGMLTTTPSAITMTGWTSLWSSGSGYSFGYYKISDGTEGSSATISTTNAAYCAYSSYRITNYIGTPQSGTEASGTNANPDPPTLSPSWGNEATLWIAMCGHASASLTVSAYPSGYSDTKSYASGGTSSGAGVGSATNDTIASSENPGTFTISSSATWRANTIAVRGPGNRYVYKSGALNIYNSASGSITAAVTSGGSVVATGVSSIVHTITVSLSGGTLSIQIDALTPITAASGAAPNTSNDWIIGTRMPYITYYKETVGGIEKIDYAPITLISGTTLPNNDSGGSYPGAITWGNNPSGITATLGALLPTNLTKAQLSEVSGNTPGTILTITPPQGPTMYTDLDTSKIPAGDAVDAILGVSNTPPALWWFPFLFLGLVIVGMLIYDATQSTGGEGSLLLMCIIVECGLVALGLMGTTGSILPLWCAYLFPIPALAICLSRRHVGWG